MVHISKISNIINSTIKEFDLFLKKFAYTKFIEGSQNTEKLNYEYLPPLLNERSYILNNDLMILLKMTTNKGGLNNRLWSVYNSERDG